MSARGSRLARLVWTAALAVSVLACSGSSGAPSPTPGLAQKMAAVNARDADHPDASVNEAVAADEFDRILDCAIEAYGSAETEQHVADVIYRGWVASGKRETFLAWAQAFC